MKRITAIALAFGAAISLVQLAQGDEIQFTTLPQPVQTTVIRETHIANPSYVTRVVQSENGVYAVTVRGDAGPQVVYVDPQGAIVQAPSTTTTTTTTVQQPASGTAVQASGEEGVVTFEQVQKDLPRYQLIEKKGKKEVYYDRQTGQKVTVKREND